MTADSVRRRKLFFFVTEDWYFVSHRLPLAIAARDAGYEVSVVTRVRECGKLIRAAGIRLIPFEISRNNINPLVELPALVRLVFLFKRERPDIVHNVAMKPILYGSLAARISRTGLIVNAFTGMGWLFTSDDWFARLLQQLVRRALGPLVRSGIVLVQNPDDFQLMLDLGVPASRIRRIAGSGVDLGRFIAEPEPDGVPVVVLPARLLWDKGVGEFVAAAQLLKESGVAARFVLAGKPDLGNPSSVPVDQIARWVEDGVVEHVGWVNDMPTLLARSHIICLPSHREGLPKSLVEAAAAGRPIVTTDVPGCREAVRNGDNGLLVPPGDIGALAEALTSLIRDPAMRQRMGARGRIRAEKEFGLEVVNEQTLALYAECRV